MDWLANADKVLRESNWSENSEPAVAAATPMSPLATLTIPSVDESYLGLL